MIFHHGLHNINIVGNVHFLTTKLSEILHWLWFSIRRYDDFDVFWEKLGQPKCNVTLLSITSILKTVNSFEHEDNFIVEYIQVFNGLIFNSLVTNIKPVGKIFTKFFFMELYFLVNVELFPKFDEDTVDSVKVITVVASCCSKMQDYQVIIFTCSL